MNPASTR